MCVDMSRKGSGEEGRKWGFGCSHRGCENVRLGDGACICAVNMSVRVWSCGSVVARYEVGRREEHNTEWKGGTGGRARWVRPGRIPPPMRKGGHGE